LIGLAPFRLVSDCRSKPVLERCAINSSLGMRW
jgi:hypothetical protein